MVVPYAMLVLCLIADVLVRGDCCQRYRWQHLQVIELAGGSEMIIDVAPGVDWTAVCGVMVLQQVRVFRGPCAPLPRQTCREVDPFCNKVLRFWPGHTILEALSLRRHCS
jgi:hypothetical protein